VAELADALDLGSSPHCRIGVRVPSLAPVKKICLAIGVLACPGATCLEYASIDVIFRKRRPVNSGHTSQVWAREQWNTGVNGPPASPERERWRAGIKRFALKDL
jgi:hypothetical protein